MVKTLCVRFNLDRPDDRRAWETIHSGGKSANRIIIDAINDCGNDNVAETVRTVLKEFFKQSPTIPERSELEQPEPELSDIDFDFLGG